SLEQLQQNLAGMVEKSQAAGAKVLLLGMQLPPNYGPRYTQAFAAVYPALGERYRVPVLPFLLEGVGGQAELMQADGIHPRSSAQPRLLENRSEEHTSELQSRENLVCRLLLEKKKIE